jgi:glycerophosphoryl diester phosphodiesterase
MSRAGWITERPIAHRGLHDLNRKCWENTLAAFDAAAARGYAIECDVHLSADGVPVVFHDDDLARLTGREGKVFEQTAQALESLAVGGTGEKVPTLRRALELVAGRVPLVIELKGIEGRDDDLVAAVAADLDSYAGQVAVMSFEHRYVRRFAADAPGIACGLTAYGRTPPELEAHFSMLAHPIDFVSFSVMEIANRFVETVRTKLSMPVITWTVRDEWAVEETRRHADQMTFEGFLP